MIRLTRSADVEIPDGPFCNFEKSRRCLMLRTEFQGVSDREAQRDGLGATGGTLVFHFCSFFGTGLERDYDVSGYVAKKCAECRAAWSGPIEPPA